MMTCDWLVITVDVFNHVLLSCCIQCRYLFIYLISFRPCLFSVPEIFIPDAYGTITVTGKWIRFMALVSVASVMGLIHLYIHSWQRTDSLRPCLPCFDPLSTGCKWLYNDSDGFEGSCCGFRLQIFLEQKKMFKTGLNSNRFRKHVAMIEEETTEYFKRWGDAGERGRVLVTFLPMLF